MARGKLVQQKEELNGTNRNHKELGFKLRHNMSCHAISERRLRVPNNHTPEKH